MEIGRSLTCEQYMSFDKNLRSCKPNGSRKVKATLMRCKNPNCKALNEEGVTQCAICRWHGVCEKNLQGNELKRHPECHEDEQYHLDGKCDGRWIRLATTKYYDNEKVPEITTPVAREEQMNKQVEELIKTMKAMGRQDIPRRDIVVRLAEEINNCDTQQQA